MYYLVAAAAILLAWVLFIILFTPGINYHIRQRLSVSRAEFLPTIQATCQAAVHAGNRITSYASGGQFYPAMIAAIRQATGSVNLECYIFRPGRVADDFIDALTDRSRQGVVVTVVLDAVGSATFGRTRLRRLRTAGCRVAFYQPLRWHSIARVNNRTHRELLIIDGRLAFIGGAGVADWWMLPHRKGPPWRDTMARVEGPIVAALQGVFAENWLEVCGEILDGDAYFPSLSAEGTTTAFVVKSSPADRATVSRVVFQMLIEGAARQVLITSPYFLPDASLRRALVNTAARGVDISVLVAGPLTDQRWVRLASRRLYGKLLEGGLRIFEYQPAMMHAKVLLIDDLWAVLGTTNIDNRSFEHNDEVNLAMYDAAIAKRLEEDFARDLANSAEITLEAWRRRPLWERLLGPFVWVLERQQ